jgi:hypothetical protein
MKGRIGRRIFIFLVCRGRETRDRAKTPVESPVMAVELTPRHGCASTEVHVDESKAWTMDRSDGRASLRPRAGCEKVAPVFRVERRSTPLNFEHLICLQVAPPEGRML